MEVAVNYGRLMTKLSRIRFDAETTFFGPFILVASLLPYLAMVWSFIPFWTLEASWSFMVRFAALATGLTLLICGAALIYASKPRKIRSLLWLPFVYFYGCFQAFIALYAVVLIVLRRPRVWQKTDKQGVIRNPDFQENECVHA